MADGYRCKDCGHYEASHDDMNLIARNGELKKTKRGYKMSLYKCGHNGFTLNKRDQAASRATARIEGDLLSRHPMEILL